MSDEELARRLQQQELILVAGPAAGGRMSLSGHPLAQFYGQHQGGGPQLVYMPNGQWGAQAVNDSFVVQMDPAARQYDLWLHMCVCICVTCACGLL